MMATISNNSQITDNTLKICSYNMHGFNNGLSMLQTLCTEYDIIVIQEHWLLSQNLDKFGSINDQFCFYATSSMDSKVTANILVGRPFGGVAILWRKALSDCINLIHSDESGRYITARLHSIGSRDIYLTCVYFPCMSSVNQYIIDVSSIVAYVDNTLTKFVDSDHIVAGDFNFECKTGVLGFDIFSDIASEFNLVCCDNKNANNVEYSYFHETLNHKSLIDHFFISYELSKHISCYEIIDSGANMSDHLPVSCTLNKSKHLNVNNVKVNNVNNVLIYRRHTGEIHTG